MPRIQPLLHPPPINTSRSKCLFTRAQQAAAVLMRKESIPVCVPAGPQRRMCPSSVWVPCSRQLRHTAGVLHVL